MNIKIWKIINFCFLTFFLFSSLIIVVRSSEDCSISYDVFSVSSSLGVVSNSTDYNTTSIEYQLSNVLDISSVNYSTNFAFYNYTVYSNETAYTYWTQLRSWDGVSESVVFTQGDTEGYSYSKKIYISSGVSELRLYIKSVDGYLFGSNQISAYFLSGVVGGSDDIIVPDYNSHPRIYYTFEEVSSVLSSWYPSTAFSSSFFAFFVSEGSVSVFHCGSGGSPTPTPTASPTSSSTPYVLPSEIPPYSSAPGNNDWIDYAFIVVLLFGAAYVISFNDRK